jgi:hypothetical protein
MSRKASTFWEFGATGNGFGQNENHNKHRCRTRHQRVEQIHLTHHTMRSQSKISISVQSMRL